MRRGEKPIGAGRETVYASFLVRLQLEEGGKDCRGRVEHIQSREAAAFVGWQELADACRTLLSGHLETKHHEAEER